MIRYFASKMLCIQLLICFFMYLKHVNFFNILKQQEHDDHILLRNRRPKIQSKHHSKCETLSNTKKPNFCFFNKNRPGSLHTQYTSVRFTFDKLCNLRGFFNLALQPSRRLIAPPCQPFPIFCSRWYAAIAKTTRTTTRNPRKICRILRRVIPCMIGSTAWSAME